MRECCARLSFLIQVLNSKLGERAMSIVAIAGLHELVHLSGCAVRAAQLLDSRRASVVDDYRV
jgi:hypothetical protein